jgi:predicted ATPase
MFKKYVLDGPPGSGKTTLLFGKSDETEQEVHPNLKSLGFECITESARAVAMIMIEQGIPPENNMNLLLERIVEMGKQNYLDAHQNSNLNKTYFFDRCFHHWIHFRETAKVTLPEYYDSFNSRIRFSEPIFILAPIESFDLTTPLTHRTRRFTLDQRKESYVRTKQIYLDLDYKVVDVPVFTEQNIVENNKKRMDFVLNYIDKSS